MNLLAFIFCFFFFIFVSFFIRFVRSLFRFKVTSRRLRLFQFFVLSNNTIDSAEKEILSHNANESFIFFLPRTATFSLVFHENRQSNK